MSAAQRPKKSVMSSSVSAWIIPATGVRPPFFTLVAVRAMAPVAGMPPKSGETMLATPCATSSMLERCLPPIMPSATTAESSDSIAGQQRDGEGRAHQRRARSRARPAAARAAGSAASMRAEPAADRLDRQMEQLHQRRSSAISATNGPGIRR